MSKIKPEDENFKVYTLTVKEFAKLIKSSSKDNYHQLEKVTMVLIEKGLIARYSHETKEEYMPWMNKFKYEKGKGFVTLCFSKEIQPFLLSLKKYLHL